jgi:DNA invertase Pin-like site-specific DNA recombinase
MGRYDDGARPPHADVLVGLAEFERELIRARTHDGRERAKAKGVKLGRKPKLTEHQCKEAIRRRDKGE